jgi:hypothetical protein
MNAKAVREGVPQTSRPSPRHNWGKAAAGAMLSPASGMSNRRGARRRAAPSWGDDGAARAGTRTLDSGRQAPLRNGAANRFRFPGIAGGGILTQLAVSIAKLRYLA